jgi:hypothetical protein
MSDRWNQQQHQTFNFIFVTNFPKIAVAKKGKFMYNHIQDIVVL